MKLRAGRHAAGVASSLFSAVCAVLAVAVPRAVLMLPALTIGTASFPQTAKAEARLSLTGPHPQTPYPGAQAGGEGGSGHGSRSRPESARLVALRAAAEALSGNVVTPSGDSQVFRTPDNHVTYAPQKGYHTRLVRNDDLSYDFFDKAGVRHHFLEPEDPDDPGPSRRLEYIEEPHGDRIVLTYDGSGLVTRVAEVHPESGEVRALALTYQTKGGSDRISKILVPALALQVDYEHDAFGNLVGVRRTGANVDGQPGAPPRTEGYRYSFTNCRQLCRFLRNCACE